MHLRSYVIVYTPMHTLYMYDTHAYGAQYFYTLDFFHLFLNPSTKQKHTEPTRFICRENNDAPSNEIIENILIARKYKMLINKKKS